MMKLQQLIQDTCPNGVEFKKLGDLGVFENTGVDKKSHDDEQEVTLLNFMDVCRHKYIDASVPTMVVTAPDKKIVQCNVLKDDIFVTPSSETIDEIGFAAVIMEDMPNVVYSYHIMRYRLNNPNTTTAKFIRYLFEAPIVRKQILKSAKGLTRFGLSKYQFADIEIPIPPLEIQKKIVECLDKFSALAAELQAELQKRRTQYEYYRTQLLTPPPTESNSADNTDDCNWEWKTFAELGAFYGGLSGKTKEDFKDGNAKYITYLNIGCNPALRFDILETVKVGPNERQNTIQYGDALFTGSSETPDECAMSSVVTEQPTENIYLNSFCFGFRFNSLDGICPAFYKHYFRCEAFRKAVRRTANGTTRFNVSKKEFAKLSIPIPPIAEQKRIADILDKFEKLISSMEEGIPAEQAAQQKRYEYYRDLLLTFPRKEV